MPSSSTQTVPYNERGERRPAMAPRKMTQGKHATAGTDWEIGFVRQKQLLGSFGKRGERGQPVTPRALRGLGVCRRLRSGASVVGVAKHPEDPPGQVLLDLAVPRHGLGYPRRRVAIP